MLFVVLLYYWFTLIYCYSLYLFNMIFIVNLYFIIYSIFMVSFISTFCCIHLICYLFTIIQAHLQNITSIYEQDYSINQQIRINFLRLCCAALGPVHTCAPLLVAHWRASIGEWASWMRKTNLQVRRDRLADAFRCWR